jgi:ubiquinone/menaquinone biosynthesis C-methylase UbiE
LEEWLRQPGTGESSKAEFTRQAASFAASTVLGAPEQIRPVLDAVGLGPDDRVLDVGCGTGFLLLAAAERASQAVGVDVTPAMLTACRKRLEEAGLTNVTLREGNAEALPFCDQRFDVVLTRLTLHHMAHPQRVLSEMYRVLRSGGRVAVCDIVAADDPGRADLHNRLERLRDPSHVQHYPAAAVVKLMEQAGFRVTGEQRWSTLRHFGEWTRLATVRPEVQPALETLLASYMEGDAAGIQAGRAPDGELTFTHHWLVVAGVK